METNEMTEKKITMKEKWENLKEKKWFRRTMVGLGIGALMGGAALGLRKLCGSKAPEALPEMMETVTESAEKTVENLD